MEQGWTFTPVVASKTSLAIRRSPLRPGTCVPMLKFPFASLVALGGELKTLFPLASTISRVTVPTKPEYLPFFFCSSLPEKVAGWPAVKILGHYGRIRVKFFVLDAVVIDSAWTVGVSCSFSGVCAFAPIARVARQTTTPSSFRNLISSYLWIFDTDRWDAVPTKDWLILPSEALQKRFKNGAWSGLKIILPGFYWSRKLPWVCKSWRSGNALVRLARNYWRFKSWLASFKRWVEREQFPAWKPG